MDTAFASEHKWDRNAFLGLVILAWIGLLMGFGPQIQHHVAKLGLAIHRSCTFTPSCSSAG